MGTGSQLPACSLSMHNLSSEIWVSLDGAWDKEARLGPSPAGMPNLQLLATATEKTSDASTDATEKREQSCCAPLVSVTSLQRGWGPKDQPSVTQSTAAPSPESPRTRGQRRRREHSSIPLQAPTFVGKVKCQRGKRAGFSQTHGAALQLSSGCQPSAMILLLQRRNFAFAEMEFCFCRDRITSLG